MGSSHSLVMRQQHEKGSVLAKYEGTFGYCLNDTNTYGTCLSEFGGSNLKTHGL